MVTWSSNIQNVLCELEFLHMFVNSWRNSRKLVNISTHVLLLALSQFIGCSVAFFLPINLFVDSLPSGAVPFHSPQWSGHSEVSQLKVCAASTLHIICSNNTYLFLWNQVFMKSYQMHSAIIFAELQCCGSEISK